MPIKNPFSDALYEQLLPIFESLADPAQLEACKEGKTQNPNESLHHLLWSMAPKEQYTSPPENELALCLAVSIFNDGFACAMHKMHARLELEVSKCSSAVWGDIDEERIKSAEYRNQATRKIARKDKKRAMCKKTLAFQKVEGDQYKSDAFY